MDLPRAIDGPALHADIFAHLSVASAAHGPRVVVHDGPLFSRDADCAAVVALLDRRDVREVLNDPVRFPLPRSGALAIELPDDLVPINRSLHGLGPATHRAQRAPLAQTVTAIDDADAAMIAGIVARRGLPARFPLMATMRALTTEASARLLFGDDDAALELGRTISRYFELRRAATGLSTGGEVGRDELIAAGRATAAALRHRVAAAAPGGRAVADRLATSGAIGADDLVAHLNILHISSSEPLAAVLAWTLLILTQRPDLACDLAAAASGPADFAAAVRPVLLETMRLLTPNALMTRVVERPTTIDGCTLAARTEILLSPLLMHRDKATFADPLRFHPERWRGPAPPPFAFLPFGGGVHVCIGREFALSLLVALLRALVESGLRPALDDDRVIDWRMAIVFQPAGNVVLRSAGRDHPTWQGPVSNMIDI